MKTTIEEITKTDRINIEKYFETMKRMLDSALLNNDISTISAIKSILNKYEY